MDRQFLEVGRLSDPTRPVHSALFLRPAGISFSRIDQLPTGAVREFDLCGDAIWKRHPASWRPSCLGKYANGLGVEEEAEVIQKVTGLPQNTTTTLRIVGVPMLRIQRARHDTKTGNLWTRGRIDQLLEIPACRGKSTVKPYLDSSE